MRFCFGDIVVVEGSLIGVIVRAWTKGNRGEPTYEVYVRMFSVVKEYEESRVARYMVRHKYLNEQEMEWQENAVRGV